MFKVRIGGPESPGQRGVFPSRDLLDVLKWSCNVLELVLSAAFSNALPKKLQEREREREIERGGEGEVEGGREEKKKAEEGEEKKGEGREDKNREHLSAHRGASTADQQEASPHFFLSEVSDSGGMPRTMTVPCSAFMGAAMMRGSSLQRLFLVWGGETEEEHQAEM